MHGKTLNKSYKLYVMEFNLISSSLIVLLNVYLFSSVDAGFLTVYFHQHKTTVCKLYKYILKLVS